MLLLTNILFGIFTGVIKFYYICSYKKDRKAKKGKYPAVVDELVVVAGCFFMRIKMLQFVHRINSCTKLRKVV